MQLEFSPLVHHPMLILGTMLQRRSCMLSSAFSSLWGWFTSQGRKCIGNKVNRRSFPKELILPNRCPRGTYKYRSIGPLLACTWFDKRPVYFLSTSHVTVSTGSLSSTKRSKSPRCTTPSIIQRLPYTTVDKKNSNFTFVGLDS